MLYFVQSGIGQLAAAASVIMRNCTWYSLCPWCRDSPEPPPGLFQQSLVSIQEVSQQGL